VLNIVWTLRVAANPRAQKSEEKGGLNPGHSHSHRKRNNSVKMAYHGSVYIYRAK